MTFFFDVSTNPSSQKNVENTDFRDFYPAINKTTSMALLAPYVEEATRDFVLNYLDEDTYETLATYDGALTAYQDAQRMLKKAVAEYTIYLALGKNIVNISDMGSSETNNDNTAPITLWRYNKTRWECITSGDRALDAALSILEENIALFVDWQQSEQYKYQASSFFKGTRIFERHASITGRRAFLSLLPFIRQAEDELDELLSVEREAVVAYLDEESPTDLQSKIIDLCRTFIAATAQRLGLPQLTMVLTGNKYMLASNAESYDRRSQQVATWISGDTLLDASLRQASATAAASIKTLFFDNPDIFTDWKAEYDTNYDSGSVIVGDNNCGAVGLM